MSNFFILNASDDEIFISLNGGDYINVPAAENKTWTASRPSVETEFTNKLRPPSGKIGIGDNEISVYPTSGGAGCSTNFILSVPKEVRICSIQFYLFWKDATSVAWVALNSGQPFQVSFTTANPVSITAMSAPTNQMAPVEEDSLSSSPCTITAHL